MFFRASLTCVVISSVLGCCFDSQESDDCKNNFATSPKSHAQGATKYDNAKVQDQCKSRCLAEAECKAVDWNFVRNECWLHYAYDKPLESEDGVNHFTKCSEEYIDSTAGFLSIERNHFYTTPSEDINPGIHVVITVPPAGTPAAINKNATLKAMEIYIDIGNDFSSVLYVGIARANGQGGFDNIFVNSLSGIELMPLPRNEKIRLDFIDDGIQVEAGDVIYVSSYGQGQASVGVSYDVGEPGICGTSYKATLSDAAKRVFTDITPLFECWMLSVQMGLVETH